MNRREFLRRCGLCSVLGVTAGCLFGDSTPHTETVTVYNRLDKTAIVSLDVRRSGGVVISRRKSIHASETWAVGTEFGAGTYEITVAVADGASTTKSWTVSENQGADRGLGVQIRESGIELTQWTD